MKTSKIINHLGSFWAMEERVLEQFLADSATVNVSEEMIAKATAAYDADAGPGYAVTGGVAEIQISGMILKHRNCMLEMFGVEHTSAKEATELVNRAANDSKVSSIRLLIDSPGGTVSGVQELADAVYSAGESKHVESRIEDMAASAAYWIASQGTTVTANPSAAVGSIGVYMVADDTSAILKEDGVKRHVISSHELKGAGVDGSEITANQIKNWQREINDLTDLFVAAVARGRKASVKDITKSATGQVWYNQENVARGLVDDIRAIEEQPATDEPSEEETEEQQDSAALAVDDLNPSEKDIEMEEKLKALEERAATTDGKLDSLDGKLDALSGSLKKMVGAMSQVQESTARGVEAQKNSMIETAQAAGKITPNTLEAVQQYSAYCADDVVKFQAHIDSLGGDVRTSVSEGEELDENGEKVAVGSSYVYGMDQTEKAKLANVDEINPITGAMYSRGLEVN